MAEIPGFNRVLTIRPAKSAGRGFHRGRESDNADIRYPDLFDAADEAALAPGAPAYPGRERGQRRYAAIQAERSRGAQIRRRLVRRRPADASAHEPHPSGEFRQRGEFRSPARTR